MLICKVQLDQNDFASCFLLMSCLTPQKNNGKFEGKSLRGSYLAVS